MKRYEYKAVITGADHPTGLGTARALSRLDIEIVGICLDPFHRCCQSRVWSEIVKVEDDPEAYLQMLIYQGRSSNEKPVLIPTQDPHVQLISDNRDVLGQLYHFVLPDAPTVDLLMDKTAFHGWAARKGYPVPESYAVSSKNELDAVLREFGFPVVLKPLYRTKEWNLHSPHHKIYKLNGREELNKIGFDLFAVAPKFIIQQWIPGGDGDVHFCLFYFDRGGNEVAHYTGRKVLQWQVGTGNTAICMGTANNEVHSLAVEIFRAASFRGLGSIEFKHSQVDNKYYITEPTVGRNNLQSYVAVAGGINLTKMAFFDALGHNRNMNLSSVKKAIWIEEYNTFYALRYLIKRKEFQYKRLREDLRDQGKVSFAYFQLNDPAPFLYLIKDIIFNKKMFGLRE